LPYILLLPARFWYSGHRSAPQRTGESVKSETVTATYGLKLHAHLEEKPVRELDPPKQCLLTRCPPPTQCHSQNTRKDGHQAHTVSSAFSVRALLTACAPISLLKYTYTSRRLRISLRISFASASSSASV